MPHLRCAGAALATAFAVVLSSCLAVALTAQDPQALFDGRTLTGWDGDPAVWRVEDGCILGSTQGHAVAHNTFLIWRGGEVEDFELSYAVRLVGNNSGVQYRAYQHGTEGWVVGGYQCDINPEPRYVGMLYEEGGRGIVATRGMKVAIARDGNRRLLEAGLEPGDAHLEQWHTMRIVARGPLLQHYIDGQLTVEVRDEAAVAARRGLLALQIHAGEPMRVWFKDLVLKRLPPGDVGSAPATAGLPQWIWDNSNMDVEERFFRRVFALPAAPTSARLAVTCDNHCRVEINGERVVQCDSWEAPRILDVTERLHAGANTLAVHAWNDGGAAGLCAELVWTLPDGTRGDLVTDDSWRVGDDDPDGWDTAGFDDKAWQPATVVAPLGGGPWADSLPSDAFVDLHPEQLLRAVPAIDVEVPDSHRATRLLRLPRSMGSWVSLARDDKGRFYASDQTRGLYRVTLAARAGEPQQIEKVAVDLEGCQGLCWTRGVLYAVVNGDHSGLYRVTDTDGDDRLDRVELLRALAGRGEHGPHGVALTQGGERLLVICGNHTTLPELARSRVPRNWRQDAMPSRMEDPGGHAIGIDAPGGFVCSCDRDGKDWELICCGLRNSYALGVLSNGEVVTYDSDMEWDMGLPWYRPTRVLHVLSGVDYGWRGGSAKWAADLPDTLPSILDVGPGSPTGLCELAGGVLALDWTFGIAYRVELQPSGASYRGVAVPVARGKPLPLTAVVPDDTGFGCYLVTGGRGLSTTMVQIAPAATPPGRVAVPLPPAIEQRRALEAFHGRVDPAAIAAAWPFLGDADPVLRYAARVALEWQPVAQWRERALAAAPDSGWTVLTALLALVHQGAAADLEPVLASLARIDSPRLEPAQRLAWIRVHELALLRLGPLADGARRALGQRLLAQFPIGSARLDAELCTLLAALDTEGLAQKAVPLLLPLTPSQPPAWGDLATRSVAYGTSIAAMIAAMPPIEQLALANGLRALKSGWTPELHRAYFQFLTAARQQKGGASYDGYLQGMFDAAWSLCSDAEKQQLAALRSANDDAAPVVLPSQPPHGPGHHWTVDEATAAVQRGVAGRDLLWGRNLFRAVGCAACHRFGGEGGGTGPDLTGLQGRFRPAEVVESIVDPNKVVSDQYLAMIVTKKDGNMLGGRVVLRFVDGQQVFEVTAVSADAARVRVPASEVAKVEQQRSSPMPPGLADRLNEDELRDLVAFLLSGGGDERDQKR